MPFRQCKSGVNNTQEHLETCKFTKEMRTNLYLGKREDKIVVWRKITRVLKNVYDPNSNITNMKENKSTKNELRTTTAKKEIRIKTLF